MIKITELTRDFKAPSADYIFDKSEKLIELIPYLYKKLMGEWYIVLVDPKLELVRQLLDTSVVPEYVTLEIMLESNLLVQLTNERPKLITKSLSVREQFDQYIADLDIIIDPKAKYEITKRVGMHLQALKDAVELLITKVTDSKITAKDVRLYVVDNSRIYASTVMREFLLQKKMRWDTLAKYEKELGTEIAYYAIRKYLRKLQIEKNKYLKNEDTKDRLVTTVDTFTIMHALMAFELSNNYNQLYIIMHAIDDRSKLPLCEEEGDWNVNFL